MADLKTRDRPRIVFAVMSAVAPAPVVDQLARALAPHIVLVHHDFSQQPQFKLTADNVRYVPHPVRTGWGVFGFVDGIFHTLRHALSDLDFDYLQLLSPSCLPIKPMHQFEAHVRGPADAHFDCIDVLGDRDALMTVGHRAFTSDGSLLHRLSRRLGLEFFGPDYARRDEAGIWLRSGGRPGLVPWMAYRLMSMLSRPSLRRHPFDHSFRPYYGSTWFGARRRVVHAMVDGFDRQGVRDYFSRLHIAEEFLVPTLLMHADGAKGPMNHYIQRFDEAHPGLLGEEHMNQLRATCAYFGRKFPADANAWVRRQVLTQLCGTTPFGAGGMTTGPEVRPSFSSAAQHRRPAPDGAGATMGAA